MKTSHLKASNLQTISHHSSHFLEKTVQKFKFYRTFLGIEPASIDLEKSYFDKAVGFYYPQPLFKFQVTNLSRSTGIGKKLFLKPLIFNALQPKIAKNKRASRVAADLHGKVL